MATATMTPFADVLEAVDRLSLEDQQELVDIVQRRIAEERRSRLVAEVHAAEKEYADGLCKTATVDEIMQEILS